MADPRQIAPGRVGFSRRYQMAPLERRLTARLGNDRNTDSGVQRVGVPTWAAVLGEDRATIHRWRRSGLNRDQAERAAIALGEHPYLLWPEMRDHDIEDITVKCAAPDCPVRFVPPVVGRGQKPRRYCCRTCQLRTNARRRYHEDPANRERRREFARRYKREVAELEARRRQSDGEAA